jgi:hypothetical protein
MMLWQRQEVREFEASLGYTVNSKSVWTA